MSKNTCRDLVNKTRREIASKSVYAFMTIYGHGYVPFGSSKAHEEIYDREDLSFTQRGTRWVVAAPRNFGKTTAVTTAMSCYALCFNKESFILIGSNTLAQAEEKVEKITKFLIENPLILDDFPELFGPNGKFLICSNGEIITANGIRVLAAGFQQKIRGLGHGPNRPSLVILDDLDSESHSKNFEQKEKVKSWFSGTLLKIGDEKTNYIVVGNIFNRFSVIGDLCSDKTHHDWQKSLYKALETFPRQMDLWKKLWDINIYSEEFEGGKGPDAAKLFYERNEAVMNEDAVLLWPERYSLFSIMLEFFRDPASFYAELQNQPREAISDDFSPEKFTYWDKVYSSRQALIQHLGGENGVYYAACDPATGKGGVKGDYSAIVILGVKDNIRYVVHESIRRRSINELIDDILAYCRMYKFRAFRIETNGGQEYFYHTLLEKARDAKVSCNFKSHPSTGDKISRISSMAPDLRVGTIQLSRENIGLIDEAMDFPHCKNDDGLDALQMAFDLTKGIEPQIWFGANKFDQRVDSNGEEIKYTKDGERLWRLGEAGPGAYGWSSR